MMETEHLIIKKAEQADWRDMLTNVWSHEETTRYLFYEPTYTEQEAYDRMARTVVFQREHPGCFTIYEKATGRAIGHAGVERIEGDACKDRGLVLGPDWVGKGYGKETLRALIQYAFGEMGVGRFIYTCRVDNIASNRLALSCGFTLDHQQEVFFKKYDQYFLENYYVLKKEDAKAALSGQ